jgi:hypothetical protein
MALHDYPVHRFLATGIAGLSVAADSLSAIKYAQVKVLRDETGLAVDYASTATSRPSATTTTAPTPSPSTWSSGSWPRSAGSPPTATPNPPCRC